MIPSWTELPDEISLEIFQYLPVKDLNVIALTCKRWNLLSSDNYLWKKFGQQFWPYGTEIPSAGWKNSYSHLISNLPWKQDVFIHYNTFYTAKRKKIKILKKDGHDALKKSQPTYTYEFIHSGHISRITAIFLSFSLNRKQPLLFLTGSFDGMIKIWTRDASKHLSEVYTLHNLQSPITALTQKENHIFCGSLNGSICLWAPNSPESFTSEYSCLETLTGHKGAITSLETKENEILFSASADKTIRIWQKFSDNYGCIQILKEHLEIVTSLHYSSEDHELRSGSFDKTIKIWKCDESSFFTCLQTLATHKKILDMLKFPYQGVILISDENHHIICFDKKKSTERWNSESYKTYIKTVQIVFNFALRYQKIPKEAVCYIPNQQMTEFITKQIQTIKKQNLKKND